MNYVQKYHLQQKYRITSKHDLILCWTSWVRFIQVCFKNKTCLRSMSDKETWSPKVPTYPQFLDQDLEFM